MIEWALCSSLKWTLPHSIASVCVVVNASRVNEGNPLGDPFGDRFTDRFTDPFVGERHACRQMTFAYNVHWALSIQKARRSVVLVEAVSSSLVRGLEGHRCVTSMRMA